MTGLSVTDVFAALLVLGLLTLAGKFIRSRVGFLRAIFLPSSIVAGTLALLLGPEVLGRLVPGVGWWGDRPDGGGLFPESTLKVWSALPSLLISVVFAALFLGKRIPGPRTIWRMAGPQVAFGQTVAWGQYVVGIGLALLVLSPVFGLNPMAGALIEISFEGGHGTAAGLAGTFEEVGFAEGADLALGLATIGVVMSVLLGTVMVNWAARSGRIEPAAKLSADEQDRLAEFDERESDPSATEEVSTTDPLSVHLGFVGLAVAVGWCMREGLVVFERITWGGEGGTELLAQIPLFPLAMLGGVAVQIVVDHIGRPDLIDRQLVNRISGAALDMVVIAALATLSLEVLGDNAAAFLLLAFAGIAWNVGAFVVLAPRIIPDHWFERGIGDFGQSMGMTVSGLLLMRIADPPNRSGALESFGYKQLLFEPVVGGGLFTAASLPLIAQFGAGTVLAGCALLAFGWATAGMVMFGGPARATEDTGSSTA
jgi:glutamate:Na+ symporter, ESS family